MKNLLFNAVQNLNKSRGRGRTAARRYLLKAFVLSQILTAVLSSSGAFAVTVTSITPVTGSNSATSISITDLAGTDFASSATIKLVKSGESDRNATSVVAASQIKLTGTLPIFGLAGGQWDVVVVNHPGGETSTLTNGFTVNAASGVWTPTRSMSEPRSGHTATLLPNGKVLVTGGGIGDWGRSNTAELYDPSTGRWASAGTMSAVRRSHTATLLQNGKVLITGGGNQLAAIEQTLPTVADIYDPDTNGWSTTNSVVVPRYAHSATLLPDGRVLVSGGRGTSGVLSSAEIYDPGTGNWTATGSLWQGRTSPGTVLLQDGRVLTVGGDNNGTALSSTEIYDPATGNWTTTGSMSVARSLITATIMADGKVLAVGGISNGDTSETYNPASGTWSTSSMVTYNYKGHTATLLPNGTVLVVGGGGTYGDSMYIMSGVHDPVTGTWAAVPYALQGRTYHTATLLDNGNVLVVGGGQGSASTNYKATAEIYITPPPAPTALAGVALSSTSILWTWTDNSGNEDGFRLLSGNSVVSGDLAAGTTEWIETDLTPNTMYARAVAAYNAGGISTSAAAGATTYAAVPESFALTVQSRTGFTASWGANGNPAGTRYQVDYSTDPGFAGFSYSTTTSVSIGIGGLLLGETYFVRAKAFNVNSVPTSTVTASATLWALPVITAITPDIATNTATTAVTVAGTGTGLRSGDTARLEKGGVVLGSSSTIVSATSFQIVFGVFGVEPGVWNVILEDAEGNESAVSAATQFTVSTGTTEGGIAITPLPSTGAVSASGGLTVTVSSGIPELSGGFIFLSTDPVNIPLRVSSGAVAGAGIAQGNAFIPNTAVEIVAYRASQVVTSFSSATVEISITYPDSSPSDGIVDGTAIQEGNLYMVWLDTATGNWTRVTSTVDAINNKVIANVSHFSVYGVAGTSAMPDLSSAKVYPNPWKPGSGGSHDRATLKFDNLADNTSVKIYNLVGELVDSLSATAAGYLEWDGKTDAGEKASSGVYFAYVKSGAGQKVLKFAIER